MKIASSRVTADSLPDGIPLSLSVSLSLSYQWVSVSPDVSETHGAIGRARLHTITYSLKHT